MMVKDMLVIGTIINNMVRGHFLESMKNLLLDNGSMVKDIDN
jgi:hypothetical protein